MPTVVADAEVNIAGLFDGDLFPKPESTAQISLQDIDCLVQDFGASWESGPFVWQRRRGHRTMYHQQILLTPVEAGEERCGEPCVVQGKEISAHGVSFAHTTPIPHRFAVLCCELPSGVSVAILTRLKWCRFTKGSLYESGGEFLRVIRVVPPGGVRDTRRGVV